MFWPRWTVVCLVSACVLVSARPLHATEVQSEEVGTDLGPREAAAASAAVRGNRKPLRIAARAKRRVSWYGYQTLAADAAAGALILTAARAEFDASWLVWPGIAAYFVGAPLVHWAHGGHASLRSFGLRLLPPAILAVGALGCYAAAATAPTEPAVISPLWLLGYTVGCGAMLAGILAFPAAIIVDAAVFAYERVEPPTQSLVFPSYDPTRRAGMLTWAGTF